MCSKDFKLLVINITINCNKLLVQIPDAVSIGVIDIVYAQYHNAVIR